MWPGDPSSNTVPTVRSLCDQMSPPPQASASWWVRGKGLGEQERQSHTCWAPSQHPVPGTEQLLNECLEKE